TDTNLPPAKFRRKKTKLERNGFTLVEMMVTLFILALLTTIVAINVLPNQDKAMVQKAKADIAVLGQALETYRLDNLTYPDVGAGLQALVTPPTASGMRTEGYIKKLPMDPWNRPYQYSMPGKNGAFDIYSLGADGAPGGENENADIYGA
ncbi:type II secretion system major pseudopilin GspG, partial [Sphingorhabdus sp.]|uniref:type II secretion system major pseudopilin GspG n=1 Tax=Sphingorhabdus sp. TaxID=1902408 RepID=UPI0040542575